METVTIGLSWANIEEKSDRRYGLHLEIVKLKHDLMEEQERLRVA